MPNPAYSDPYSRDLPVIEAEEIARSSDGPASANQDASHTPRDSTFASADQPTRRLLVTTMLQQYEQGRFFQAGAVHQALTQMLQRVKWRTKRKGGKNGGELLTWSWTNLDNGGCGLFFDDVLAASLFIFATYDAQWSSKVKLAAAADTNAAPDIATCLSRALARLQACSPL